LTRFAPARYVDGILTERYYPNMATAYASEAIRLRRSAGITDDLLARATGAARSTVRDWLAERTSPTGMRAERVGELASIVDRLPRVMRADYIPVWLAKPIEALGDEKPVDLIGRGEYIRVARVISGLEDPGAV
jgi:DNA-binding transcriptional regulator YiaG